MLSQKQSKFLIIGVMSGTSLDGLDLVATQFDLDQGSWRFEILLARTFSYPTLLVDQLGGAIDCTDEQVESLDNALGQFIGKTVKRFSQNLNGKVDFVASHGHTVLHQPELGYTLQIGNGKIISDTCGLPVISNFRENDVKLGGQGAPLVPIGDRDLFGEYDLCLNLGGIANISQKRDEEMLAYDICPFNMALNELSSQLGLAYDNKGQLASEGNINVELLESLNNISYLTRKYPKSLGLEDYRALWLPTIVASNATLKDKMRTFTEHAAMQVAKALEGSDVSKKVLITGGGTFHQYFLSRLEDLSKTKICIPEEPIINFKEALVFAYLGLLRYLGKPNCLKSVTGADKDSSGGDLYNF